MAQQAVIDPFYIASVAWALTVVGWFISNWQANRREQRKELRTLIKKTEETLEKICLLAERHLFPEACSNRILEDTKNVVAVTSSFNQLEVDLLPLARYVVCKGCRQNVEIAKEQLFDFATGELLEHSSPGTSVDDRIQALITVKAKATTLLKRLEES